MSEEYDEMRRIQAVRQAEIAAWRTAQGLDEARDLEVHSINRATNPGEKPTVSQLNEPIDDEDDVEVQAPKPKAKPTKPPVS